MADLENTVKGAGYATTAYVAGSMLVGSVHTMLAHPWTYKMRLFEFLENSYQFAANHKEEALAVIAASTVTGLAIDAYNKVKRK